MKANELMIGDWVMYNGNIFIDDEYEPSVPIEPKQIDSGEDIDLAIEGCYAPIPLTPEILEKNGWDMYGCPDHKCWEHYLGASEYGSQYVPFSICLFDFMNKGSMYGDDFYEQIIIHVRFVHELQHALRLCGLTELADNFKI